MRFENMFKGFSSLQKVKIALVIAPSLFWVIIAMIYITQNKGLSADQFFGLIGIYYILCIFLSIRLELLAIISRTECQFCWGIFFVDGHCFDYYCPVLMSAFLSFTYYMPWAVH